MIYVEYWNYYELMDAKLYKALASFKEAMKPHNSALRLRLSLSGGPWVTISWTMSLQVSEIVWKTVNKTKPYSGGHYSIKDIEIIFCTILKLLYSYIVLGFGCFWTLWLILLDLVTIWSWNSADIFMQVNLLVIRAAEGHGCVFRYNLFMYSIFIHPGINEGKSFRAATIWLVIWSTNNKE